MASKFGKFFLFSAAAGAVAASTYYYLKHQNAIVKDTSADNEEDDDFDDFSEDLDDEPTTAERSYVSLDLDKAKNVVGGAAEKALEKTADCLNAAADKISETAKALDSAIGQSEHTTEEFFDDDDAAAEESASGTESSAAADIDTDNKAE